MTRVVGVLLVLCLAFRSLPAHAVSRWFCEVYDVDFADSGVGDYLTDSDVLGRGVKFRFTNNDDANDVIVDFADETGAHAGCVNVDLDSAHTWTVVIFRHAEIGGNVLKITNTSHQVFGVTIAPNYAPIAGPDLIHHSGVSGKVHIMAAASYALVSTAGDVTGELFEFHDQACSLGAFSCYLNVGGVQEIFIHPNDEDEKFVILHELGHAMFDAANGFLGMLTTFDADMNDCSAFYDVDSTGPNSKEYQSAAAFEGFADFYSALVVNDPAGGECDYNEPVADWNLDGNNDASDPDEVPCDDRGIASLSIDGHDFGGDYCVGTGTVNNRGTEYDWMRMLWHMRIDHGLTIAHAQELWVDAVPTTWTDPGDGTGNDYPAGRFRVAAGTASWDVNFGTTWNAHDDIEGVHR